MSGHGGKREGAGRKPGSVTQKTRDIAEAIANDGGLTPLEYLVGVMRDVAADEAKRIDAAKAAAPYLHPRLNAIDHSASDGTMGDAIKGALAWKPPQ